VFCHGFDRLKHLAARVSVGGTVFGRTLKITVVEKLQSAQSLVVLTHRTEDLTCHLAVRIKALRALDEFKAFHLERVQIVLLARTQVAFDPNVFLVALEFLLQLRSGDLQKTIKRRDRLFKITDFSGTRSE